MRKRTVGMSLLAVALSVMTVTDIHAQAEETSQQSTQKAVMPQSVSSSDNALIPKGKAIYIPEELRGQDWNDKESEWSFHRMACTENVACFWQKGFGDDLSCPPDLEGKPMKIDLQNLLARIEYFYQYYRDILRFTLPGSNAEKYRMMVMLNYSLDGTAYGGSYDNVIGALWIAPNRVQDKTLNCIAHEIGHSFQIQISCDGQGGGMGGGVFEMCSQWMLWLVNPNWVTDENYHWEAFRKLFHKRFLDGENIYHSPYVLEYWSQTRGPEVMGNLFRGGQQGEDPAMTYMRLYDVSLEAMGDEMYDCYSRLVTFDDTRIHTRCKQYAEQLQTPMMTNADGTLSPEADRVAGVYGFNVVKLPAKAGTVEFTGKVDAAKDGYRWGVVLVDGDANATYLPMQRSNKGKIAYTPNADTRAAYLVVVGCPADKYEPQSWGRRGEKEDAERTYPFVIKVKTKK